MTLRELLVEKQVALCERWRDAVLAEYGELTASRWRRERDPFANPIGQTLSTGLPSLLQAIASEGEPPPGMVAALEAIVRFRSIQDFTPSRAVGFVYHLRDAIHEELAAELAGGAHAAELAVVHQRIERLLSLAFDVYVRLREQVFRLRQDELKRSVASILRRWHGELPGQAPDPEQAPDLVRLTPLADRGAPR